MLEYLDIRMSHPEHAVERVHTRQRVMRGRVMARGRRMQRRQRGLALILVLWGAALLTIMAASFAFSVRVETTIVSNYMHRAQAQALAEAGVRRAILEMLAPPGPMRWHLNGESHDMRFGEGAVRIAVFPESAKLDLNRSSEALIHGLFGTLVGEIPNFSEEDAARLTEEVDRWRDPEGRTRSADGGQLNSTTRRRLAQRRVGGFLSTSELNQIPGMRPEILRAIADSVTVHSQMAKVDAASATRRVLLAIPGLDSQRVDQFLAAREALYQDDDEARRLQSKLPLELLEAGARHLSRSRISTFTVNARAMMPDGVSATVSAVVRVTGQRSRPYSILAWSDMPFDYANDDSACCNSTADSTAEGREA